MNSKQNKTKQKQTKTNKQTKKRKERKKEVAYGISSPLEGAAT